MEVDQTQVMESDEFTLVYDFEDGQNPSFTFLPDAECGDSCLPASWRWQVIDNNGIGLDALIQHLRNIGQIQSAMRLEDLRARSAHVVIFQTNRRWNLRWGVPVYESGSAAIYGHEQQFVVEQWRRIE
jgi:hypothetical protein